MKSIKKRVKNLKNGDIIASPVIYNGAIIISKNTPVSGVIIDRLNEANIKVVKIKEEENVESNKKRTGSLKDKYLNYDDSSNPSEVISTIRMLESSEKEEFPALVKIGFQKFTNPLVINELIIQCKRITPDEVIFGYLCNFLFSRDNSVVSSALFILQKNNKNLSSIPYVLKLITLNKDKIVINKIINFFKSFDRDQIYNILTKLYKGTNNKQVRNAVDFVFKALDLKKKSTKTKTINSKRKSIIRRKIKDSKIPDFSVQQRFKEIDYYSPVELNIEELGQAAEIFKQNYTKANKSIEKVFTNAEKGEPFDIKEIKTVVSTLIDEIFYNKDLVTRLRNIFLDDNYLYRHSVNVCLLSMLTGIFLDYESNQIAELGISALLADIGMMNVKDLIWNKDKILNKDEFENVKYHIFEGIDILKRDEQLKDVIATVSLQHHERNDGSGYLGFKNKDICQYAKIVAVCDVFDALVSPRNYRKAFSSNRALNYMISNTPSKFDAKVMRAFLKHIGLFPVGAKVLLSNGEIGTVSGTNNAFWAKPKINISESEFSEINLRLENNIYIKEIYTEEGKYEDWSNI